MGEIEYSDVFENEHANIIVENFGTNPHIFKCELHNGKSAGIWITENATGKIEQCSIENNELDNVLLTNQGLDVSVDNCVINGETCSLENGQWIKS